MIGAPRWHLLHQPLCQQEQQCSGAIVRGKLDILMVLLRQQVNIIGALAVSAVTMVSTEQLASRAARGDPQQIFSTLKQESTFS